MATPDGCSVSGCSPLPPFKLERHFAKYEFSAPYLLCCSDCQPLTMAQLLGMADEEAKQMWQGLGLGYTETAGLPALREEAARRIFSSLHKDQILVAAPEECIYLTMHALLKQGDTVVCMYPGYQSLYELACCLGCSVVLWEPELGAGGSVTFSVDALKALLSQLPQPPKLVVANAPHNPTGFTFSRDQFAQLVGACQQASCYLFSDEMYRLLELDPSQRLPCAADVYPRAISLTGLSKSLSAPGLRVGLLGCRDAALLGRVQELKDWTTICSSAPSEVLALIALRSSEAIVASNVATIRANIQAFQRFMERFPHAFEWQPPAASSVAFPRLTTGEPVDAFCDRVVQGCGVLLLPASVYGHAPCTARGHFRIGLGRTNFQECLDRLREFLESPKGLAAWSKS